MEVLVKAFDVPWSLFGKVARTTRIAMHFRLKNGTRRCFCCHVIVISP
jgi:hypothetical protein